MHMHTSTMTTSQAIEEYANERGLSLADPDWIIYAKKNGHEGLISNIASRVSAPPDSMALPTCFKLPAGCAAICSTSILTVCPAGAAPALPSLPPQRHQAHVRRQPETGELCGKSASVLTLTMFVYPRVLLSTWPPPWFQNTACTHMPCAHAITHLHPPAPAAQNEKWTEEEDAQLEFLVQKHGNHWTDIGKELGRFSESCRDRWRHLAEGRGRKTGEQQQGGRGSACAWALFPHVPFPIFAIRLNG